MSKNREAEFTTRIRNWLRDNVGTGAFEIKHTRGEDKFLMRELYEHQRDWLLAARSDIGIAYKIPDDAMASKPFDVFVLRQSPAYVVIAYPKEFVIIDIHKIQKWTAPTLPLEHARSIASFIRPMSVL